VKRYEYDEQEQGSQGAYMRLTDAACMDLKNVSPPKRILVRSRQVWVTALRFILCTIP